MTKTDWTETRIEAMTILWLEGVSVEDIARRLGAGATRSAVLGKLRRLGVSRASPGLNETGKPRADQTLARRTIPKPVRSPRPERVQSLAPSRREGASLTPTSTLSAVRRGECRWPIGDPGPGGLAVCGRSVSRGAYCSDHAVIGYQNRKLISLFALAGVPEG